MGLSTHQLFFFGRVSKIGNGYWKNVSKELVQLLGISGLSQQLIGEFIMIQWGHHGDTMGLLGHHWIIVTMVPGFPIYLFGIAVEVYPMVNIQENMERSTIFNG
jgi:hypothetical protein